MLASRCALLLLTLFVFGCAFHLSLGDDNGCPGGKICTRGYCVCRRDSKRVCSTVEDCPSGHECKGGVCVKPALKRRRKRQWLCGLDGYCPWGMICVFGKCEVMGQLTGNWMRQGEVGGQISA